MPPFRREKNAALWEESDPRNKAVQAPKVGELAEWEKQSGYHQCSKAERGMYCYKQLISPKLSLRNHNAQVGEMLAGVTVLNRHRTRNAYLAATEQVAEHLSIGLEAVSRMERGLVVPTIVRLAELAQLFDCDIAELLRESSNRPTDQGVVLAQHLARLNSADRSMLFELIEKLSDRLADPIA